MGTVADIFDITGSRALVTGSTRGIGYAFAGALVRAGCVTVVHGRDPAATAKARDRLLADAHAGARVHTVSFDVTDADAVAAGVAAAQDAVGALDIVVNNAGVQHREPAATVPVADWRRVVDTNLTGAFLVSRAAAPSMMDRRRGKIVNVCSLMSELARPGITPYAAAKGGLKAGDLIVEIAGRPVTNLNTYMAVMSQQQPGQPLNLTVMREGKKVQLKVMPQ